jgi:hypothetical protein
VRPPRPKAATNAGRSAGAMAGTRKPRPTPGRRQSLLLPAALGSCGFAAWPQDPQASSPRHCCGGGGTLASGRLPTVSPAYSASPACRMPSRSAVRDQHCPLSSVRPGHLRGSGHNGARGRRLRPGRPGVRLEGCRAGRGRVLIGWRAGGARRARWGAVVQMIPSIRRATGNEIVTLPASASEEKLAPTGVRETT